MKRQVRRGAFETNSSSTHAICITKSEYRHNSFSHIDFEIGEFGWENDEYDSLYNKASYLITAILSLFSSQQRKVFEEPGQLWRMVTWRM